MKRYEFLAFAFISVMLIACVSNGKFRAMHNSKNKQGMIFWVRYGSKTRTDLGSCNDANSIVTKEAKQYP